MPLAHGERTSRTIGLFPPTKINQVNIHQAKTHLSRLIEHAVNGEPFVIAKSGRPLVKVVALSPSEATAQQRIGFLAGQVVVPDDFDSMGREHIENNFLGMNAR